jgi:hypothetical protein
MEEIKWRRAQRITTLAWRKSRYKEEPNGIVTKTSDAGA